MTATVKIDTGRQRTVGVFVGADAGRPQRRRRDGGEVGFAERATRRSYGAH